MSNGEIIISVVTAVLVVFSLVVSVVIPKRDPSFPGKRNLVAFGLICAVLIGGTLAAIEVYGAEEGHGAEALVAEGEQAAEEAAPAVEGEEAPAEEPAAPAEEPAAPAEAPPAASEAGRSVFMQAGCASCHALADADATGAIGPNLDEAMPALEAVVDIVTNGRGAMPAFAGQLSEAEIQELADYVVAATSG